MSHVNDIKDEAVRLAQFDLTSYDAIVINTSAGKDSQAMMDYVVGLAKEQGVLDRVVAVHADLGRVEWKGTKELAAEHCAHYGIPLHVVTRPQGDLLQQIEERGMFPDSQNRYCTSDQKRGQICKLHVQITKKLNLPRKARILNCMGLRAEESSNRAKKPAFEQDKRNSNGKRDVFTWLPIHAWTTKQVWAVIRASGVKYHPAYDLGMPRLSCCFCIFAPKNALMIAGQHNPELLAAYVALEEKMGHTFRHGFRIGEVAEALARGEKPGVVQSWTM